MRSYGLDLFVRTAKLQILSHFRWLVLSLKYMSDLFLSIIIQDMYLIRNQLSLH